MSLKDKLYEEVKENTIFALNFEHQRLRAQLDDSVSALKDSLTSAQRVSLSLWLCSAILPVLICTVPASPRMMCCFWC